MVYWACCEFEINQQQRFKQGCHDGVVFYSPHFVFNHGFGRFSIFRRFQARIAWAQIGLNRRATTPLADLSGMVWVGGNRFIAVHDAKVEDEFFKPRVAALRLPRDSRGITYKDSRVSFRRATPNDLESVAAIPGTNQVLLVESGDSKHDPSVQRIFKADVKQNGVRVRSVTQWPFPITNVEGTAVARLGETHVFLYAERADNLPSTELSWVVFDPKKDGIRIDGPKRDVRIPRPGPIQSRYRGP